jgi:AhpD family alkylhydroperoxidase
MSFIPAAPSIETQISSSHMNQNTSALEFPRHTFDSAPAVSKPTLQKLKEAVGMVPNLAAAMAESPKLIEGFSAIRSIYQSGTFSPVEREVLSLTNAIENDCHYCRAIHSTFALKVGMPADVLSTLRAGGSPSDPKLKALTDFARAVVRDRGNVPPNTFQAFFDAGYSKAQALEVLLGLANSILANYSAHFTRPELDAPLQAQA